MPRSHPTQGSCFVWGHHTSPRWDTGLQERQEMLHFPWGPHLLHLLSADAEKTLHLFLCWMLKPLAKAIMSLKHPKSVLL